jgi:magnesium chelatase subunit D
VNGRSRRLPENRAITTALLLAADPHGLGGAILRGMPGERRDRWLDGLRRLLPEDTPWRKVPVNVGEDRLLGGLDFAATLAAGKPVYATGLIESTHSGILLLSMAERLSATTAALVGNVLDSGAIRIERDGSSRIAPASLGVIALDESLDDEAGIAEGLADRLAFRIVLDDVTVLADDFAGWNARDVARARNMLGSIEVSGTVVERLCGTSAAFGIESARADLFALRAARAAAALSGRDSVDDEDAALAAALVLPHRATRVPQDAAPDAPETDEPERDANDDANADQRDTGIPDDLIVDAVQAALPPGLLELLARQTGRRRNAISGGRGGPRSLSRRRGRPVGVKQVDTLAGARLNVLATIKAAAPWQTLRRAGARDGNDNAALRIRKADLRVTRFEDSVETTTVFVVDASGSQAARRLAEVKGAIELLLNDCYVRRDQVALIAFRGSDAEVLLPPTRALARAKRELAAMPGGGGTPLAAGLDAALELAGAVLHQGREPNIVLMTDGRANVARDNQHDIARAEDEALSAASQLKLEGIRSMLVDTARRPRPRAQRLAESMGAHYVPLPQADAATISAAVQANAA